MVTDGVDGRYMKSLGELLLREFPDFRKYITLISKGFESHGLDIHIVGQEFDIGYIRIARVVARVGWVEERNPTYSSKKNNVICLLMLGLSTQPTRAIRLYFH